MTMTPGNYLEHAAEWFWSVETYARQRGAGAECDRFSKLIPVALKSPRFLLPFGGIVHDVEPKHFKHLEMPVRLPYPMTVLEFVESGGKVVVIATETYDSRGDRCIATNILYTGTDPDTAHVWAVSNWCVGVRVSEHPMTADGGLDVVSLDIRTQQPVEDLDWKRLECKVVWCTLSLILALQCCNVTTETIPAPLALNRKRSARGKLPFVEYKILTVGGEDAESNFTGGTHVSPRQHIRRGHVRRLPHGRRVWVHQCLVGDPKKGMIVKDYRVNA